MSGSGSPADHTDTVDTNVEGAAPASAAPDAGASKDSSGDANLSASPSSGEGDKGATKDQPKPTLAEVIKTAAEAKPDDQGKSPAPAKEGTTDPAAVEGAASAEGEQDDSKLPFHNHPRWKEVIAQNQQFKAEAEKLRTNPRASSERV